jgi:hypothetical protein
MHAAKDCRGEQLQHNKFEEDQTQEIHAKENISEIRFFHLRRWASRASSIQAAVYLQCRS